MRDGIPYHDKLMTGLVSKEAVDVKDAFSAVCEVVYLVLVTGPKMDLEYVLGRFRTTRLFWNIVFCSPHQSESHRMPANRFDRTKGRNVSTLRWQNCLKSVDKTAHVLAYHYYEMSPSTKTEKV